MLSTTRTYNASIALVKIRMHIKRPRLLTLVTSMLVATGIILFATEYDLLQKYRDLESVAVLDRNGTLISLAPNVKGVSAHYVDHVPERVASLLIGKEDKFFYEHPGLNPISILRAALRRLSGKRAGGASTITQQLVKNLLMHEQNRSLLNKIQESVYALDLELFSSKKEILTMYANTVYMGNQLQGLGMASELYFGKRLEVLSDTEIVKLLATLSSPSTQNPWTEVNDKEARHLAEVLGVVYVEDDAHVRAHGSKTTSGNFELASMGVSCTHTCTTTIDIELTNKMRALLREKVRRSSAVGGRNGAIVVVKLPENEILSIVGSPNPESTAPGSQINMAIEPRPIGSTVKPFIYVEGFARGLRPYTLVDDREYKFTTGEGYALYPKNYDGFYHGWVSLHSALSNSLNVPSVKVLQYVGLSEFYDFLEHKLEFVPLQDLDSYQYGIALGGREMDPLTLASYLTIFPQQGILKPLSLYSEGSGQSGFRAPMSKLGAEKRVADRALTQLVTKILNDRASGVEQFGLVSNLNLSQGNYAVKTGTSRDYHDSWTVGYTPDFLVVTWLGNAENEPLIQVTGQSGAGSIWHDAMELLINSEYNKRTPFAFDLIKPFPIKGSLEFGLPDDLLADHRDLLPDNELILSPLAGDRFRFEARTNIPLISPYDVEWYANGTYLGHGTSLSFTPKEAGRVYIKAVRSSSESATVEIDLVP